MSEKELIHCPICQAPCDFLTVRDEEIARCISCGNVLRKYHKEWMSDKQAIENLYRRVDDLNRALSAIGATSK